MDALSEEIKIIKRGQVWIADFGKLIQGGHRIQGIRPCLIISNDVNNRYSPVVQVIPISSNTAKKPLPVHVPLLAADTGLERNSIALCEQSTVLNKEPDLRNLITTLNSEQMTAIEKALLLHMGISL